MQLSNLKKISRSLLIWLAPTIIFLSVYISKYHYPIKAGVYHFYFIFLILAGSALFQLIISNLLNNKKLNTISAVSIYVSWLFLSIIYYLLVLIGLKSWGNVITVELITSYFGHASKFANSIGINLSVLAFVILVIFIALTLLSYYATKSINFKINFSSPKRKRLAILTATSLLLLILSQLSLYIDNSLTYAYKKEPVALTLNLGKPLPINMNNIRQGLLPNLTANTKEENAIYSYKTNKGANKKNIILIVVDALRSDHMGIYGYNRETTPFLSSLKANGAMTQLFNTRSSCTESACGLMSIASSRYIHLIPQNPFTLHKVLKTHDYNVSLILGGDHTNFYNLGAAYGKVDSYFDGSMADISDKRANYFNDDRLVLNKIDSLTHWNQQPIFMQLHLMSTHHLGTRWRKQIKYSPQAYYGFNLNNKDYQKYINFYDNGVLQTDFVIEQIFKSLKTKGYLENALVIITADHAESLGEHGLWSHASSVYDHQLKIPLLFINFGDKIEIETRNRNHSQIDIASITLCSLDIPVPSTWNGEPCDSKESRLYSYFMNKPFSGLIDTSNPDVEWKYFKNHFTDQEFVFNISNDPKESKNLVSKVPHQLLTKWRNMSPKLDFE